MQFENVYWDPRKMEYDGKYPSILAIGDSWFWYPFMGGSLLNSLGPLVAPKAHTILAYGNNGAEAFDYVHGVYESQIKAALKFHGPSLSAVFISGGGNDFAGFWDLRPLLDIDCSGCSTADECFVQGDHNGTLEWLMKKTLENIGLLVWRIFALTNESTRIFIHNYDYAIPSGKGVLGTQWLKPALDNARVPAGLHKSCIILIVDAFTAMLQSLANANPQRIILVDSRETLSLSDWANELHPTPDGFKKLVKDRWAPLLVKHGLAP